MRVWMDTPYLRNILLYLVRYSAACQSYCGFRYTTVLVSGLPEQDWSLVAGGGALRQVAGASAQAVNLPQWWRQNAVPLAFFGDSAPPPASAGQGQGKLAASQPVPFSPNDRLGRAVGAL